MIPKTNSYYICKTLSITLKDFNLRKDPHVSGFKLYSIELSKFHNEIASLIPYLSSIEVERAQKFHFLKDKNRFIICRTILKFLLAEETNLSIKDIALNTNKTKKPYLPSHPNLFFNVTHSENYAFIAISKNPIGIDIEHINTQFNFNDFLDNVFSKSEVNTINNSLNKYLTFYQLWTRKEAIVKAMGTGIDDNIPNIQVLDGIHHMTSRLTDLKNLNVFSFNWHEDYLGTVAVCIDDVFLYELIVHPIPNTFMELINIYNKKIQ